MHHRRRGSPRAGPASRSPAPGSRPAARGGCGVDEIGPPSSASSGTAVMPMPSASARAARNAASPPRRWPKAKSGPQTRCTRAEPCVQHLGHELLGRHQAERRVERQLVDAAERRGRPAPPPARRKRQPERRVVGAEKLARMRLEGQHRERRAPAARDARCAAHARGPDARRRNCRARCWRRAPRPAGRASRAGCAACPASSLLVGHAALSTTRRPASSLLHRKPRRRRTRVDTEGTGMTGSDTSEAWRRSPRAARGAAQPGRAARGPAGGAAPGRRRHRLPHPGERRRGCGDRRLEGRRRRPRQALHLRADAGRRHHAERRATLPPA